MFSARSVTIAVLGLSFLSIFVIAQNESDAAVAANLEHYWAYGRSPPVYPFPQGTGTDGWETAYAQARALVAQMTNDEKNNITYGYTSTTTGCSASSGGVPRLGYPGMCMQNGGNGVLGTEGVNGYPPALHIGASWNKNLAFLRAQAIGAETKRKGINAALGPVVGPLGRVARGGRNWEGFSNDPYLAGSLAYDTVVGLQQSVIACVKHFVGYEQETNRLAPRKISGARNVSVSSNMDDKTLHELYLWPFQDAVRAGAGAIMCSYNQLNGSSACQNSKALNGVLKGELGFQGLVVGDWGAQESGLASAEAGLDMALPSSTYWENGNLTLMVANGSLAQSRLDDMATRILATWYRYARFEDPGFGVPINLFAAHDFVDARDPASKDILLQAGVEGHVLVKNVNGALPLEKPKYLGIYGYDALAFTQNAPLPKGTSASGFTKWAYGLENTQVMPGVGYFSDDYLALLFLSSTTWDEPVPGVALNGTMISGGGSDSITPSYVDAPFDAIQRQARLDDTFLTWDFYNQTTAVPSGPEACLVFVNEQAAEGWDRPYLADPYSDTLIENIAGQCNNTIVVIHHAGVRLVDRWIDHPNITAVIYAHLPGQDSGQALVEILYGYQSPSGRLPYTVAKNENDYGNLLNPTVPNNTTHWHTQSNFTEGVYIDYKHFLAQNITPRFEFGYGLTYTTFNYSSIQASAIPYNTSYAAPDNTSSTPRGGDSALWEAVAEVSCTITNTGIVAASEVAQLYVYIPGGPEKVLRGFAKTYLKPSENAVVRFQLTRKDLSEWDVISQRWQLQKEGYDVFVGKSVLDIQLTATLSI
ncbi:hypothetical protein LTR85_000696 [Meristemomyces frigidus]|nr:hypothetical protein LTR85_000696 [Meristemomyces frigidus]